MDAEILSGAEREAHHAHILLHLSLKQRRGKLRDDHKYQSAPVRILARHHAYEAAFGLSHSQCLSFFIPMEIRLDLTQS
jgi:hypothetical protein